MGIQRPRCVLGRRNALGGFSHLFPTGNQRGNGVASGKRRRAALYRKELCQKQLQICFFGPCQRIPLGILRCRIPPPSLPRARFPSPGSCRGVDGLEFSPFGGIFSVSHQNAAICRNPAGQVARVQNALPWILLPPSG